MRPLIVLSDQRLAAEVRNSELQAQASAEWSRRLRRLAVRCTIPYLAGLFLAFLSLGMTGESANIAFWGGLVVGNGAILGFLFALWAMEGD